jgi:hypothetical protein
MINSENRKYKKDDEENIHISGYGDFVNNFDSETEIVNKETTIKEDHIPDNINNNNYEHEIVREIEMFIDQYYNNNFLVNENEDEEENKIFGDEYEEFKEEKEKNIKKSFSDFLEYDFHKSYE